MPLHLLGYTLRTFEAQLAERARKRPAPVVPIVLHHGERPWTAPARFIDWMNLPHGHVRSLFDFIPDFTHVLAQSNHDFTRSVVRNPRRS